MNKNINNKIQHQLSFTLFKKSTIIHWKEDKKCDKLKKLYWQWQKRKMENSELKN